MGDDVPQTETREAIPFRVDEKGDGFIEAHRSRSQVGFDGSDRFRPQRAGSLFATFAEDADMVGAAESDLVDIQIHQLLGSHAGVVEQPEQGVVASSKPGSAVDLREDFQNFLPLQVFGHALCVALEPDREDGFAVGQITRFRLGDVPKEGMNGCQAVVARRYRIVPFPFEVVQKAADGIGLQVFQGQTDTGLTVTAGRKL
jgi:hypothetical protein